MVIRHFPSVAPPEPDVTATLGPSEIVQFPSHEIELVVADGRSRGERRVVQGLHASIGTGPNNDLRLRDRRVSRLHCEVVARDDYYLLRDMGSKNGTMLGQYGLCRQEKQTILIRPGLDGNDLRETLLHEMCHIGSTGHGKRFQAKLARLASLGERWAEEQRASYEEACRSSLTVTAIIRHTIDDWVWQCADIPWIQIRRLLAREVGLSPNRLIKAAPWVRRVWQREVAEWRVSEHKREMLRAKLSRETSLPRNS